LAKDLHEEIKALEIKKGNLGVLKPKLCALIDAVNDIQIWLNKNKY
jgi:hypothetical protein